jgi:hypothetical protein
MVALVTAGGGAGRASRFVTLSLTLALIGGCNARDTSGASKSANAQTWAPDQLTSIQDVPAAEVETLIQQKLEGPRPPKIDDDQWGHTKRLYKLYGNNPLLGQAIGALKQTRFLGDVVAVKTPPDGNHLQDLARKASDYGFRDGHHSR